MGERQGGHTLCNNPHCPLCYPNQKPILPQQTLSPAIRPITLPSSGRSTIAGPAMARCRRSRPKRSMTSTSRSPSSARIGISSTGTITANIGSVPSNRSSNSSIPDTSTCWLLGLSITDKPNPRIRKGNQNGSIRCWGPSIALAPDRYHFLFIPACQSALRRGPNGRRQRNRLLRVARHWLGRPKICFCSRVSSLSIASSLRAQAWL